MNFMEEKSGYEMGVPVSSMVPITIYDTRTTWRGIRIFMGRTFSIRLFTKRKKRKGNITKDDLATVKVRERVTNTSSSHRVVRDARNLYEWRTSRYRKLTASTWIR